MANPIQVLGGLFPVHISPGAGKQERPLDTGILGTSARFISEVVHYLLAIVLGDDSEEGLIASDGEARMMYWLFYHRCVLSKRLLSSYHRCVMTMCAASLRRPEPGRI
jgi:hypothetical protein